MTYAAFLRGINVGGNNKIPMKQLKASFEKAGMEAVQTYIASGNVVFQDSLRTPLDITQALEEAIRKDFGLEIRVLVISRTDYAPIAQAVPADWSNDDEQKSDVLFLWPEDDDPSILEKLSVKEGVDTAIYVPGAVLWNVSRALQAKSKMNKLVGTKLYRGMTIRNVNTVRKIREMMGADAPTVKPV